MKKQLLILALSTLFFANLYGQVGIGFVGGNDIYHRYVNPEDDFGGRSAGNAILNLHFGPKIWIGGENFSVSVETYANWGATSLSLQDYKGLGDLAFPLIAKANFGGNSAFSSEMRGGWSIGGGYQIARTELYGLNSFAREEGVTRDFYPVFVAEISRGYGFGGAVIELFGRYGWDTGSQASTLNIGISYNLNVVGFAKLRRKIERFDD